MLVKKKSKTPIVVISILFILFIAVVPNFTSVYTTHIFSVALINYLCVLCVYVLLGMCGQNSFAQAGFWGIGAYLAGNILTKTAGGSAAAFLVAACGTALLAFVLGFAFFRLKQYYFTFASIGLMTILNVLFMNWTAFSGGAVGMKEIPTFRLLGLEAASEQTKLYVVFAVSLVVTILVLVLFNSSLGRSFMAIRDNEMAADSMGINSLLTKSIAFAIAGALSNWIRLLAPFTPHTSEELWSKFGGEGFVSFAEWPKYDEELISEEIERSESLVQNIVKDINEIKNIVDTTPEKIHIYISDDWKWDLYKIADEVGKPDIGQIMGKAIGQNIYDDKKEIANVAKKISREMTKTRYIGILG